MENKIILVVNCRRSSLEYQLFLMPEEVNILKGKVEDIGKNKLILTQEREGVDKLQKKIKIDDHSCAFPYILESIIDPKYGILSKKEQINAVGHRVVHGGEKYSKSVIIDKNVIRDIELLKDLAPLHNMFNLKSIQNCMNLFPDIPHIATFDTAFHQTIPDYAYIYGLPYEYYEKYKIRKYGFHGSSHSYVTKKAFKYCKMPEETSNLISCHLGVGASVAAIASGKSCDTSMGFTPLGGLIMGTRCGDLDPAIIHFLFRKGVKEDELIEILNKKSGLVGISKISNDIAVLEREAEKGNKNAILALNAFAYKVKEYIGAYTAVMVKVNILVFTGSIGEVSVKIREMICTHLENIGIILDKEKNKLVKSNIGIISADNSPITIMVVPTHEERKIAQDTYDLIKKLK